MSDVRVARTSALIAAGTFASRITGFLRVSALAALGFARLTDVYNLANSTPNIVYELLLGGILSATLVPLFVESDRTGEPRSADAIISVALVLLAVGSVLGVLFAPWIIDVYSGLAGVSTSGDADALATDLLRWFMPQMLFYGITALITARLNARDRFAAAAFAPALNNIVVIAMLLAVARAISGTPTVRSVLDDPGLVLALGLGTTAGVVAMALVLVPALRSAGITWHWHLAPRHPAVRKLARLSSWTLGYVAANQVAFVVVLALAYGERGAVSVYLAAFTFFQLPHGLLAVSVMTALGPRLARSHQVGDLATLRDDFGSGLRLLLLVMIPAAVGLALFARPVITALLDHGDFSAGSVRATADTLRAFAVGLVPFSVFLFVVRTFSSMQDTRTPFLINLAENALNVATAAVLFDWLGVEGLGWSWTIAYSCATVLAVVALRRRLGRLGGRRVATTSGTVLLALVPAAAAALGLAALVGSGSPGRAAVVLGGAGLLGGGVFVVTMAALGVPLIRMIREVVRKPPGPPLGTGAGK